MSLDYNICVDCLLNNDRINHNNYTYCEDCKKTLETLTI